MKQFNPYEKDPSANFTIYNLSKNPLSADGVDMSVVEYFTILSQCEVKLDLIKKLYLSSAKSQHFKAFCARTKAKAKCYEILHESPTISPLLFLLKEKQIRKSERKYCVYAEAYDIIDELGENISKLSFHKKLDAYYLCLIDELDKIASLPNRNDFEFSTIMNNAKAYDVLRSRAQEDVSKYRSDFEQITSMRENFAEV